MEFVASGLVVSVVLGAIVWSIVDWLTRSRSRAPLPRGSIERIVEYGTGILFGPLILFVIVLGLGWGIQSQEAGIFGIVLATPVSAAVTWTAGELLAGPTRRSWRPMVLTFLAAQAGLWLALMATSYLHTEAYRVFAGRTMVIDLVGSVGLWISLVSGSLASAWAYRRWRSEIIVNS
jgi:hypothetical protein